MHLGHLPSGTGHVIVHYLFTGTYESLGPRASSGFKKDTAEFATSARVYGFARDYEMPGLEALARGEMEKLGSRLPVMDVLDTLNSITPRLNTNDDWFQGYLKSLIQPLIDNPSASLDSLSNSTDRTMSITNTLLKVVVELWSEKLSSGRCSSDVSQGRHGKSTTPQVHAEAGSAINHEHNPTNVLKYAPSHETHGLPIKKKKAKKTRTEAGDRIGLFWGVDAAADMSRFKDEEATKAQDIICDWTSVASTATTNLSKRALKRLSKAQQNHDSAAANNHNPEPISRPLNVIGCTIGTLSTCKYAITANYLR